MKALHDAARETEPTPEAAARVEAAVQASWAAERPQREAFALLLQPAPAAEERLARRLLATRRPSVRRRVTMFVALAAAMLLLSLRLVSFTPREEALDRPLTPAPAAAPLTNDVMLTTNGTGRVSGTRHAPHIRWDAGTLAVEVTPQAGVALVVETGEGRAEVRGTGFSVTRDDLGTTVAVAHGSVAVSCLDGRSALLGAGETLECAPIRAAGMLSRAEALRARGAHPGEVLDAITRGVALSEAGTVRLELLALRVEVLAAEHRDADALKAAEAYLAEGPGPRDASIRAWRDALAARLAARPSPEPL